MEEAEPVERVMWGMERVRSSSWGLVVEGCKDMAGVVRWKDSKLRVWKFLDGWA